MNPKNEYILPWWLAHIQDAENTTTFKYTCYGNSCCGAILVTHQHGIHMSLPECSTRGIWFHFNPTKMPWNVWVKTPHPVCSKKSARACSYCFIWGLGGSLDYVTKSIILQFHAGKLQERIVCVMVGYGSWWLYPSNKCEGLRNDSPKRYWYFSF